jgi:outer membrane PBP1 activator LpoA protein
MRHELHERRSRPPYVGLALLILALCGCAGTPEQTGGETEAPPLVQQSTEQVHTNLELPASQYSAVFRSAEQSLAQFDWMTASVTLQEIPPEDLSPNDRTYISYLQARINYARGDQEQALAQLSQADYPGVNPAVQYRIRNFRRHILELAGDNLASAKLGDQILRTAPPQDMAALQRAIWRDLQRLDKSQLQQAAIATTDPQWWGWLELAQISRNSAADTDITTWRDNNPEHPAAQALPGGLAYLIEPTPPQQKVALMLPLSKRLAPAGKAVRDGYLAAYYAARAAGSARFELLVLDLDSFDSAHSAYEHAVTAGANLVVGPLSKQAVAELGTRLERPVPVLALNRIDQVLPATGSAMVQLSLAPEDEAARIAALAFGQGARSALVIRPAGAWGDKVTQALEMQWSGLGGTLANSVAYGSREDYSSSVKSALNVSASEARAREVRDMLATNIEFTARRRQDVDVVFLLSRNGAEARSIKPLLAFHYAGNLPVYAISSIYSGIPDSRDQDLNGVKLVEAPWLLGSNPGLRVAIAAGDTGSDNYTRLNALGADAFLLQQNFSRLQAGPDVLLRGDTGLLSMDPQLRIQREPSLATFDEGILTAQ